MTWWLALLGYLVVTGILAALFFRGSKGNREEKYSEPRKNEMPKGHLYNSHRSVSYERCENCGGATCFVDGHCENCKRYHKT